jgi:hypothetical protein
MNGFDDGIPPSLPLDELEPQPITCVSRDSRAKMGKMRSF